MNVSRILALGGSFWRILRGSEALGGSVSNEEGIPGGSAKQNPSRAWGEGEGELGSYEFK